MVEGNIFFAANGEAEEDPAVSKNPGTHVLSWDLGGLRVCVSHANRPPDPAGTGWQWRLMVGGVSRRTMLGPACFES